VSEQYETPGELLFVLPVAARPKYATMIAVDPDYPERGVINIMPNGGVFHQVPGERYVLTADEYRARLE